MAENNVIPTIHKNSAKKNISANKKYKICASNK